MSKTILVVEDDAVLREIIRDMISLSIPDVRIITAENGMDALITLNSLEIAGLLPHLIVTDIKMPVMDGTEMINLIKNNPKLSHLPIIIQSASLETFNPHKLLFLEKPIRELLLVESIEKYLISEEVSLEVG